MEDKTNKLLSDAVSKNKQQISVSDKETKKIKISLTRDDVEKIKLAQEDVDFVSDSRAALLVKSTPMANTLLFILIGFVMIGLFWSRMAKLDELTRGMGKVVPASKVQIIQNLEGGILSKIYVEEGSTVEKGQILAKLDDTQFKSQYSEGYAKYLSLLASIARLKAEIKGEDKIEFPKSVNQDANLVKHETDLFKSRKLALENTLKNLRHSYMLANRELQITEPLVKKGVLSKIELLRLKRDANNIKTRIDSYENSFQEGALTMLTRQKAELSILNEKLKSLKDREDRTVIKSPVKGIVKQIYINTLGGIIKPAVPVMEVVPVNDQLIIEARIRPNDIAFIKQGQNAVVKITAYDYSIYGGLKAKVTHISADTSVDQNGNSFYEVTLKTDKNYLGSKAGSFPIMPGMVASVDIITGKKSMLSYLLKPILRAKEKAMRER